MYTTKSGKELIVRAYCTDKPAPWHPSGNSYLVKIQIGNSPIAFTFWDSYHNMVENKPVDLRGAIACWASDALTAINCQDAADIMSEFGYTDPKVARRVYKGCARHLDQARKIGLSDDDLEEIANY